MRPFRLLTCLSICVLCVLTQVGTPHREAFADEDVSIIVSENMEMEAFLTAVARTTGMRLVWNPVDKNIRGRKLKGGIVLKAKRDELFPLVRGLLTFYDLVFIPIGPEGNKVMLIADARQSSAILKLKPQPIALTDDNLATYESADGLFVTTTIHVQHMDNLQHARNALARIVTGMNIGSVTEVPDAKAFVVTDFAPNVVAIYRLLRKMDVPKAKVSTATGKTVAVSLEHASALELAEVLNQHYRSGPRMAQPTRRGAVTIPQASAPRITADKRTNRILVTGDDAEIKQVQEAIALLDTPVPAPETEAFYVRMKHVSADEVASVLGQLIAGSPHLWASSGARPAVIADEQTNALVISASKEDFAKMELLITKLDGKR
ncbi:MAG: secretin N-terminal domain-containing protein [Planctomycetota bacterium]|nr:secretin N-terminal domain-containing protein [Planctomycetota bacterium]